MFNHLTADPATYLIFLKLGAAVLCGALIGVERAISHKAAGMRTYALVSLGSAFFVIIAELALQTYTNAGLTGIDPFHIPAAVITGIGFLGAGLIIFRDTSVAGLTTASSIWVAAAIGLACGYGFFVPAIIVTLMTLFIFIVLWHVEKFVKRFAFQDREDFDAK